jgi:lipoprotein-anchoring transpeptidase ErfK/SrfK
MTLIEQGRAVQTLAVATGVPGADTPLGQFSVQYKMPVARFRGTNPGGRTYDIADVKWVLSFQGDYTIHGAYWRSAFGTPGSNGCVSLTDANAKLVYDWAPEGTLVRIHY